MMIDLLPLDLKKVLKDIEALGFSLTLVGGAPRDYIYSHQLGYDLDFEIRADHLVDRDQWPNYYKKLVAFFSAQKMTFTELPYLITRLDWGEFQLEFSSPRLEFNKVDAINHHHFDARLDSQLSYEESFKRRDLTLNAIGIEWNFLENQERFIDPYGGIDDLKKKELRAISAEYFLDPVRFLRLIRFQIRFSNFLMNSELMNGIGTFNLRGLSPYHFREELFKSIPAHFLNLFNQMIMQYKLELPDEFKFWTKYIYPQEVQTKEELLAFIYKLDFFDAQKMATFFLLPEKKLRDLDSFYKSYQRMKDLKKEEFSNILSMPLEEALGDERLKDIKNMAEKKQWQTFLHLPESELPFFWGQWDKIKISPNELEAIKPSLRSYLLYLRVIEASLTND